MWSLWSVLFMYYMRSSRHILYEYMSSITVLQLASNSATALGEESFGRLHPKQFLNRMWHNTVTRFYRFLVWLLGLVQLVCLGWFSSDCFVWFGCFVCLVGWLVGWLVALFVFFTWCSCVFQFFYFVLFTNGRRGIMGGQPKQAAGKHRIRGDINTLIVGAPCDPLPTWQCIFRIIPYIECSESFSSGMDRVLSQKPREDMVRWCRMIIAHIW